MTKELVWNVYWENYNSRKIETRNVFDHGNFYNETVKLLKKKDLSFEEFSELLRKEAFYYFCSKSEYEVIITSWPPHITEDELKRLSGEESIYRHSPRLEIAEKIDIYDQLRLNWDVFVEYVYSHRKVGKKAEGIRE